MPIKSPVHSLKDCQEILSDIFVNVASIDFYKRDMEILIKNSLTENPVMVKPGPWGMIYLGSQLQRLLFVADYLRVHLSLPAVAEPDWSDLLAPSDLHRAPTLIEKLAFLPSHLSNKHIQNPMLFIHHCFEKQSIKKWSKQLNGLLDTSMSSGSIADELDPELVDYLFDYPAFLEAMHLIFVRWCSYEKDLG